MAIAICAKDIATLHNREDAPLVCDQAEVDTHKLVGLWYALSPHNAEIVSINPVLKDADSALVAALGVAAEAVDPAWVEPAGDIEEALALQQRVLGAEEEAQGVLGALGGGEAVAEVALVADRKDLARSGARLRRCPPYGASSGELLSEVEWRLAGKGHTGLAAERCSDGVAALSTFIPNLAAPVLALVFPSYPFN